MNATTGSGMATPRTVGFMNVPLMVAIAVLVLAQKLLPPYPAVDVPLAFSIVALGVVTAT